MTTFNTREEYLAYRAEWKANYKALSAEIRQLKLEIKNKDRAGEPVGALPYKLRASQERATLMLQELKEAKQLANQQYLAAQMEKAVA